MQINSYSFKKASPIWERGKEREMNCSIALYKHIKKSENLTVLAISAHCSYTVLINSEIVAFGPARAGHGYYRVDELVLNDFLTENDNILCIKVAGYNVNSFCYLNKPSFVCAELKEGDNISAYTSAPCVGFSVDKIFERIQKTQRYSFQRTFTESYTLKDRAFSYERAESTLPVEVTLTEEKNFICRDIPYSDFEVIYPVSADMTGDLSIDISKDIHPVREIINISDKFFGYRPEELEYNSYAKASQMVFSAPRKCDNSSAELIKLSSESYIDVDFGVNYTGIVELDIKSFGEGELFLLFDEIKTDGQLNCLRNGTSNIIAFKASEGKYSIHCAEPYTMKYIRIAALGASFEIKNLRLYKVAFPKSHIKAKFIGNDLAMEKIYDAAVETFRSNATDVYMDCPSRERAGWLCDSFFTSRVENILTGENSVEKAFLSNFLMPEKFEFIPDGMLPMCYPSDHNDGVYIPNWAMWYALELSEYVKRSGDTSLANEAKSRMLSLLDFFRKYENEYKMLEKLDSWVFVEWSKANSLVQDVSFASNMLYAAFKEALADMYGDESLREEACALRKSIREMSMTESGFFCDNAYRIDGKLVLSGERTEACQYYAFFFDIATPESHPNLWKTLVNDFGYKRAESGLYPEIWPANSFIGNYLRLDLLKRYGLDRELYDNIKGYFSYMAETTGTLWEHTATSASCNHGFASHVIYWMKYLGLIK